MSKLFSKLKRNSNLCLLTITFSALMTGGCAVEAAKVSESDKLVPAKNADLQAAAVTTAAKRTRGATIEITRDSAADTVRVFYKNLRENRFREALFLTNLRPAIEGLTDAELGDLQLDLARIAQQIPAEIEINGEIVSGEYATVTAKLPDNETKQITLQEIRLRKAGNYWVILTIDEEAEEIVKKEGNKYFFNLRLQTHESEAKAMMERISKAQMVYALQNGGVYGEMKTLVENGFLPEDVLTSESTGYNYKIVVSSDKRKYFATADPAVFGKTGKLSFLIDLDDKKNARLTAKENQGQPLKK
ncbi:MAG TPA: hypothetical protein VIL74_04070 [Pyrinomonadaceae bacterium]|jgi:hypothetical protein